MFYLYYKLVILPRRKKQVKKLETSIQKIDEQIFNAQLSLIILQSKSSYIADDIKYELALVRIIERLEKIKELCNKLILPNVTSL